MAVMRLTGDRLTAHVGRVRIVRTGSAVGGIALALALLAEHPAAAFIAFACLGIGLANVFPLVVSAASRSPAPGVAIATVTTGGYAGHPDRPARDRLPGRRVLAAGRARPDRRACAP